VINRNLPSNDLVLDLLALRAAEGLSDADEAAAADAWDDPAVFDEAAAVLAIGLAASRGLEPMPPALRSRLSESAAAFRARPELRLSERPAASPQPAPTPRTPAIGWLGAIGWLAAAASLAFAVFVAAPRNTAPTPEQRLAALEARPGVITTAWLGLDDAGLGDAHRLDQSLTGKVVWDPSTREGYMVFEGLAANQPAQFQYQLWIFDETRPTGDLPQHGEGILSQCPVDGGVFDVSTLGRVVVPIDAKLPVGKAAIFAVTVEPPGGVVVSDRDIVSLALVQ
jgi:hypothetical protein